MDNFFNFNGLRKTTIQFLNIFNNIKVAKYNTDGSIREYIKVPLKYAPKEKFYYWLYERKHEVRLPMMSAYITSIMPSMNERGTNKHIKIVSCDGTVFHKALIPYTVEYELSVSTLFHNEIDQIFEQIIPYFSPYVMTRVNLPEIQNHFDCKVLLVSVSPEMDTEIPEDNYRTINWKLNFTVHTYAIQPINESKYIEEIFLQVRDKDSSNLYETLHLSGYKDESGEIVSTFEIIPNQEDILYPIANNDIFSTNLNTSIGGNVLTSDVSVSPLSVVRVNNNASLIGVPTSGTNGGIFTINEDGGFTFNPSDDFASVQLGESVETSIIYTCSDGNNISSAILMVVVTNEVDVDEYWNETVLCFSVTDNELVDSKGKDLFLINAEINNDIGVPAIHFTGSPTSYLRSPSHYDFEFPGDFTIEYFMQTAGIQDYGTIITFAQAYGFEMGKIESPYGFYVGTRDVTWYIENTPDIPLNQINYIAVSRENGLLRLSYNGTIISSASSFEIFRTGDLNMGADSEYGWGANYYLTGLRITKGVARNIESVPTFPFITGGE